MRRGHQDIKLKPENINVKMKNKLHTSTPWLVDARRHEELALWDPALEACLPWPTRDSTDSVAFFQPTSRTSTTEDSCKLASLLPQLGHPKYHQ